MKSYVVGFLFDEKALNVALIRKLRPDWQRGMLNGIGGKIEEGEETPTAMRREFREETGVDIPEEDWRLFCVLGKRDEWRVYFFCAQRPDLYKAGLRNMTDEQIEVIGIYMLKHCRTIPNLQWLIPMAIEDEHTFWPYTIIQR